MKSIAAVVAGRALKLAFALAVVLGMPGRGFAQLSVDELELRILPEIPSQRTAVFRVTNDTDAPVQALLELQDWKRDESGANQFLPLGSVQGSCREHVKVFPLSVRIDAHKSEPIRVSFDGDAAASCWNVVFVQSTEPPKQAAKQSSITYLVRTGVKVYVEPANAVRQGDVDSVRLVRVNASATDTTQVDAIELLFRNSGHAHLKPTGAVEVRSADNQVVARLDIVEFPIAPGDSRRLVLPMPKLPVGRYVALALIDYAGPEISAGQLEFELPSERVH